MSIYDKTANEKSFYKKNAVFLKCKLVTHVGKCVTINCIVCGEFTFFSSEPIFPFLKIFNSLAQWIDFAVWILLFSYYTNIQLNTVTYIITGYQGVTLLAIHNSMSRKLMQIMKTVTGLHT